MAKTLPTVPNPVCTVPYGATRVCIKLLTSQSAAAAKKIGSAAKLQASFC
jgi:hypothetical protein